MPHPSKNIPKAILFQFVFGFFSAFFYLIAILYGINDLDGVLNSSFLFPLAEIYRQTSGSRAGAVGLLFLVFIPSFLSCIGCYVTASRIFWTLARDNATPFSKLFSHVDNGHHNPFRAIAFCGVFATVMGCIYVGSSTAFSAFVGSFVVLSTLSYLAAILPHLLSRRRNVTPGWFWMKGISGFVVNGISSAYIIVFIIISCGRCDNELRVVDHRRSLTLCLGILVRSAEELRWAEEGGSRYCNLGEGCYLKLLKEP